MGKSILKKILAILARRTIAAHKPIIIGVTGSVGKTSTRNAIVSVLRKKYRVRTGEKNYNNQIGLPLSVLGIPHCGKNMFRWGYWFARVLSRKQSYPEILVLEYGVDHPDDMDYLLSIAMPKIGVVTAIGDIPVHTEFFGGPEGVIAEKRKLVAALGSRDTAVLNYDDDAVRDMKIKVKGKTISYGTDPHADMRIVNYSLHAVKSAMVGDLPDGITFKLEHKGSLVPFRIRGSLGITHAYAASAAACVGIALGMNLFEISQALENFVSPPGRLRLVRGNKHSLIIDDTYNAAPASMRKGLDALQDLPGKRKIAVLGDMKELGSYSEQAHRAVGDFAARVADILFCVGPHAKFIADEARAKGPEYKGKNFEAFRVEVFGDSLSAARALEPILQEGDLVLVKGSQSMRMERVVEEIMAEPARAAELLARQEEYWKKN